MTEALGQHFLINWTSFMWANFQMCFGADVVLLWTWTGKTGVSLLCYTKKEWDICFYSPKKTL